jgi:aryl-alcohol dehydrogenase-like predicted oxidoreductase
VGPLTEKHISIGGLDVSRIGLGAMSMSGYYNIGAGSDAESIRAILGTLRANG